MRALVHSCFDPNWQSRPNVCGCNLHAKPREAEAMVARGEAEFGIFYAKNGKTYPDLGHVVLTGKLARFPLAQRITSRNVVAAYVESNDYQAERIETHGVMNKEFLTSLLVREQRPWADA